MNGEDKIGRHEDGQLTPRPDPTFLTTEQLHREIKALRDIMEATIRAEVNLTVMRFDAIEDHVQGAREVTAVRFESIENTFTLLEKMRIEQKEDTKAAVDAALAAAKEAVKEQTQASERSTAKSENSINKQLELLSATNQAGMTGVTNMLNDTKERVSKTESAIQVKIISDTTAKQAKSEGYGGIVTIVMLAVVIITLILKFQGA